MHFTKDSLLRLSAITSKELKDMTSLELNESIVFIENGIELAKDVIKQYRKELKRRDK